VVERVTLIDLAGADLDRPLFRIYPIWLFDAALITNGGNLAVVPPRKWEDPNEDPCGRIQMAFGREQQPFSEYLQSAYGQCWSFEGESDVLMRAYSRVNRDSVVGRNTEPRLEGVKVRTTVRRLSDALARHAERRGDDFYQFYIAKVSYIDNPAQACMNRLREIGPTRLGQGWDRARSLTFKRIAYQHEQEVRVIALTKVPSNYDYIAIDVDKNAVFEEISFDPRLGGLDRGEREARVRALGYTGPVTLDDSYVHIAYLTHLPTHWSDLDARNAN
jgi:hypothetical protein